MGDVFIQTKRTMTVSDNAANFFFTVINNGRWHTDNNFNRYLCDNTILFIIERARRGQPQKIKALFRYAPHYVNVMAI